MGGSGLRGYTHVRLLSSSLEARILPETGVIMAAKKAKKAAKKSSASAAKRSNAVSRSAKDVAKAHKNLELKIAKHKQTLTAMFFIE
jgi:hypothetical protein